LDSLSSIAKPYIIETHHVALRQALAQSSPRDDIPPELFALVESHSLKLELEREVAGTPHPRKTLRV
jgi:hypothetical protein